MRSLRLVTLTGVALAALCSTGLAQVVNESIDLTAMQKIRDEGMNRSKLDGLASYLTDVIGARLTNSPVQLGLGDLPAALDCAEQVFQQRRGWLVYSQVNSIMDPLRQEPRFRDLIRRMHFLEDPSGR